MTRIRNESKNDPTLTDSFSSSSSSSEGEMPNQELFHLIAWSCLGTGLTNDNDDVEDEVIKWNVI